MKTLRVLLVAAVLVGMAGCLPDQPFSVDSAAQPLEIEAKSGSRIKVKRQVMTYVSSTGTTYSIKQDPFLYDSDLGVECSIETGTDGRKYCLPKALAMIGAKTFAMSKLTRHWLNATCTIPVMYSLVKGAPASSLYAYRDATDTTVYKAGGKPPIGTQIFTNNPSYASPCNYGPLVSAVDEIYELGSIEPYSSFAEFTQTNTEEVMP